jgi:hypothetical protein
MAAAVSAVLQLYSIVSEKKPDLFGKRSWAGEIRKKISYAWPLVSVYMHRFLKVLDGTIVLLLLNYIILND